MKCMYEYFGNKIYQKLKIEFLFSECLFRCDHKGLLVETSTTII